MKITKKILSTILAVVMVLGLLPTIAFATAPEYAYISVCEEGQFATDQNGNTLAYTAVALDELTSIDLNAYNLSDYIYDADSDGNQDITALHLFIYVHEQLLGLNFNDVDTSNGFPGGMYFSAGLFGYADENLRYNYNGAYPADENGWGFTADRIVLSDGDFFEVAHYSDWMFYADSAYGFHYFTDESDTIDISYTAEAGTALPLKLALVGGGMGMTDTYTAEAGYTVYYGQSVGDATDSVTTDENGAFSVTFPSAGTWYVWCDGGYGVDMAPGAVVSSPACASVTVTAAESNEPRQPQDVSTVLNATMAQLAATVTEPSFGTNAGEWTVLSLARGGFYTNDHAYFADYYDRIVATVNETAASVNLNGALHKNKSTDNSRLIVALSAIGKDATSVGNWNLITPYDDFTWIKKQGINGAIWALIALDSNDYQTTDTTIRRQCVEYILNAELAGGGWALSGTSLDVDITGMTLQALYNYKDQPEVAAAAERAFTRLSDAQLDNGGFLYGTGETSESAAQVIVACCTWGINPDTDSRFVKEGNSVVDALLAYYVESEAMFEHQVSAGTNNMATDQACYALVAYDRFVNEKTALYDYSDVVFEEDTVVQGKPTATLGLPAQITDDVGKTFNAVITLDQWDNTAGYKLIDFIVNVPEGLSVTGVTAGSRLNGGEVSYHLDEEGKLRVVYFDANEHSDLTVVGNAEGNAFPAQFFTITFQVDAANAGEQKTISIGGMTVKLTSDSSDDSAMVIMDTATAAGTINVVKGISYSAICLYTGDDVDLIPSTKKAVAVAVVGIENATKLTYNDGTNQYIFKYSAEISAKTGISTYVALVDATIDMVQFANKLNFALAEDAAAQITFGDTNGDGLINAQDALNTVDAWLRKGDAPTDDQILTLNVNSDRRINTFDALGIVEKFVDGSDFGVVTKAATLTTNP